MQPLGYGQVKVTIRASETLGITRLHAWAERVSPVYMELQYEEFRCKSL